jgi:hypothetical protein
MRRTLVWSAAWTVAIVAGNLSVGPVEAQWGSIKGQVVVDGDVKVLPPLVKKGDTAAKDSAVCAADDVPDESLVIDAKSKGIANVVVYLQKKPAKVHPNLVNTKDAEVVFDQKGCRFIPHVLLLRTDQQVRVLSEDAVAHNTHSYPLKNNQQNFIVTPNDRKGVLVPKQAQVERLPSKVPGCRHGG